MAVANSGDACMVNSQERSNNFCSRTLSLPCPLVSGNCSNLCAYPTRSGATAAQAAVAASRLTAKNGNRYFMDDLSSGNRLETPSARRIVRESGGGGCRVGGKAPVRYLFGEGGRDVPSPSTISTAGPECRDVSAAGTASRTTTTYDGALSPLGTPRAGSKNRSGLAARMPQSEDLDYLGLAGDRIVEVIANPPKKDSAQFLVTRMLHTLTCRREIAGKLESPVDVLPEGSGSLGSVLRPPTCGGSDLGFGPWGYPDGVAQPRLRARRSSSRAWASMYSPRSICSVASESSSSSARDSRTGSPGSVARIMTCAPSGTNSAGISTLPSITVPVASFIVSPV